MVFIWNEGETRGSPLMLILAQHWLIHVWAIPVRAQLLENYASFPVVHKFMAETLLGNAQVLWIGAAMFFAIAFDRYSEYRRYWFFLLCFFVTAPWHWDITSTGMVLLVQLCFFLLLHVSQLLLVLTDMWCSGFRLELDSIVLLSADTQKEHAD